MLLHFVNFHSLPTAETFSTPYEGARFSPRAPPSTKLKNCNPVSPHSYRHIFKYTSLFGFVQALYVLLSVVRNKLTAVLIGAAGMGLADLYARSIELLGNLTNFGLGVSAVKRLSQLRSEGESLKRLHGHIRLIRTWVLLTALFGAAVTLVLSPLVSVLSQGTAALFYRYCWLAPGVFFTTLAGGEMAILKATRQLKALALASAGGAVSTLVLALAFYPTLGIEGVLPVLVGTTLLTFVLHHAMLRRKAPYHVGPFNRRFLRTGIPMIQLGLAYIMAGVMTSGAELLVRTVLMRQPGGLANVGYYTAGFTLTVSYARMIFVAMDADYFPRLSAAVANQREMNLLINRQINMLVVLMAPFLILFALCLPLLIHILYTRDFLVVVPMVLAAVSYMYFKAIYTPIAYIPLAKGDSVIYMLLELAYDVVFALLVVGGFLWQGLLGAGIALSLANLADLALIAAFCSHHYGYRINRTTLRRCVMLFLFLLLGLCVATQPSVVLRATLGTGLMLMVVPFAWPILKQVLKRR